jgi:hypothetical protein
MANIDPKAFKGIVLDRIQPRSSLAAQIVGNPQRLEAKAQAPPDHGAGATSPTASGLGNLPHKGQSRLCIRCMAALRSLGVVQAQHPHI